MILEGSLSVKAALLANRRTCHTLYVDEKKHDPDTRFIIAKAIERNVEVKKISREEIDSLASGRTHGGILLEADKREYQALDECFVSDTPFIAVLEGVEDPYNLGYVMRSLYCAGCDGLIVRHRNWDKDEATILRASAGASEYLPLVSSDSIGEILQECKARGCYVYAAMRKDAISYFDANFKQSFVICIGGEMRGLSKDVLNHCDKNLFIPYARMFHGALNAAGASSALGFEAMRQRSTNE